MLLRTSRKDKIPLDTSAVMIIITEAFKIGEVCFRLQSSCHCSPCLNGELESLPDRNLSLLGVLSMNYDSNVCH